jgi:hypothetical protein
MFSQNFSSLNPFWNFYLKHVQQQVKTKASVQKKNLLWRLSLQHMKFFQL